MATPHYCIDYPMATLWISYDYHGHHMATVLLTYDYSLAILHRSTLQLLLQVAYPIATLG